MPRRGVPYVTARAFPLLLTYQGLRAKNARVTMASPQDSPMKLTHWRAACGYCSPDRARTCSHESAQTCDSQDRGQSLFTAANVAPRPTAKRSQSPKTRRSVCSTCHRNRTPALITWSKLRLDRPTPPKMCRITYFANGKSTLPPTIPASCASGMRTAAKKRVCRRPTRSRRVHPPMKESLHRGLRRA